MPGISYPGNRSSPSGVVTVGIPSLFLIFSVLCLCVLALLTLGSSRSGLNTARYSMEQTEKYYNACSKATETVSEIRNELSQYADNASDEAKYFSLIQAKADTDRNFSWDSTKLPIYIVLLKINERFLIVVTFTHKLN